MKQIPPAWRQIGRDEPACGTAAVNRENSPKNKGAKAVRTFAPFARATFVSRRWLVA